MKSLISKLTSSYLLGLALAILLPTFYCKVNNPLLSKQTDWIRIPSSLLGCGSVLLGSTCLMFWQTEVLDEMALHTDTTVLLAQCHNVTPEKTWISSNTAVRNSNPVCHTSIMSVNRSERWAAAIRRYQISSDECDSPKSDDYQFENEDIFVSTVSTVCFMLQPVPTADW
jgi:hypothetical protein